MKASIRLLFLCILTVVLSAGCATGPSFKEISATIPPLSQDKGRVYFYRTASFVGSAIQPDIKLNGQVIGSSKPGGFFYVDRAAGIYTVTTATEVENRLPFKLNNGETKYIKTSISMGLLVGHVEPTIEYPEAGQAAIETLNYTGAPPRTDLKLNMAKNEETRAANARSDAQFPVRAPTPQVAASEVKGDLATRPITGDELHQQFDNLRHLSATAPSGRTLDISFDSDGTLGVRNMTTLAYSNGTFQINEEGDLICFSMSNPSFKGMQTCYRLYLSGNVYKMLSTTSSYYFTYIAP